jgi:hypothetical protein
VPQIAYAGEPGAGSQALQKGASNMLKSSNKPAGQNVTMPDGSTVGPSNNYGAVSFAQPTVGGSFSPEPAVPSLSPGNFAKGGMTKDFRAGGRVSASSPKEKAVKSGNSYANDKIPAVLSEHEIVLPRSVTLSKDPVGEAAKFVAGVIAKRKARK